MSDNLVGQISAMNIINESNVEESNEFQNEVQKILNRIDNNCDTLINNDERTDMEEYITNDFSKFKFMSNNRDINKKYVAKLKNSISEKGFIGNGILVNENFEVLDGQHRLTACMELNVPIRYIIKHGYNIAEISALNMNGHNWNINTFVGSYVKSGKEDYMFFTDITERYKISTASLKVIITFIKKDNAPDSDKKLITIGKIGNDINNGILTLDDQERATIIDFLDALEIFKFFKKYHTDSFVRAFLELYFRKDYSHLQMIKRLEKFDDFLVEKKNKFNYLDILCNDIYSKGKGMKIYYNLNRRKFEGK